MIKQEFKRIFVKILVRIIILFLFLIVCYIMGSSNVKADTLPVNSTLTIDKTINNYNTVTNPSTTYNLGWNWYPNSPNQSGRNSAWIYHYNAMEHFNDYNGKVVDVTAIFHFSGDDNQLNRATFFGRIGYVSDNYSQMCELEDLKNFATYRYWNTSPNNNQEDIWPTGTSKFMVMTCKNFKVKSQDISFEVRADPGISNSNFKMRNVIQIAVNSDYNVGEQTQATKETNEHLKNQDTTGAQNGGTSFFDNFQNPISSSGLSGIVGAPITLLQNLLTGTCTPLHLNIPFVNKEFDLPCMSTIYEQNFGTFLQVYRIITFGIITYWVIIKCIGIVKNLVDPDDDKIEVLDL